MTTLYDTKVSKQLSYILRHDPESIGLKLDKNGWASIQDILDKTKLTREQIDLAVEHNEKKRFSVEGEKIRANQGHSISVDLQLKRAVPPPVLYHGTVSKFMAAIMKEGLKPMNRQHVHLSAEVGTAQNVGSRRGKAIILTIETHDLVKNGHPFYLSENNVWLSDPIPAKYIIAP